MHFFTMPIILNYVIKSDILTVFGEFSKIAYYLADGKTIYVGEYINVQASGSSEGQEKSEDVIVTSIKSVRTVFRPGKMIKDALKLSIFKKKA